LIRTSDIFTVNIFPVMASDQQEFITKMKAEAEARRARANNRMPRGVASENSDSTPMFDLIAKSMTYSGAGGSAGAAVGETAPSVGTTKSEFGLKPAMKKSNKGGRRVTFSESNVFHDGGFYTPPDDDVPLPDLHFDTSSANISAPQSWSYQDFIADPPKFQESSGPISINDVFNKLQNLYVDDNAGAPVNESTGNDSFSIDEVMRKLMALSCEQGDGEGDTQAQGAPSSSEETSKPSAGECSSSSSSSSSMAPPPILPEMGSLPPAKPSVTESFGALSSPPPPAADDSNNSTTTVAAPASEIRKGENVKEKDQVAS
jgi:hypothetical protein